MKGKNKPRKRPKVVRGENLIIYTDGGARGNPGPAGIGIVICDHQNNCSHYSQYIGQTTNNQAEYRALIFALEKARDQGAKEVKCYLDSELVVKQLNGFYKIKNQGLKPLFNKVVQLSTGFPEIKFLHIPRKKNKGADKLVNRAIDNAITK